MGLYWYIMKGTSTKNGIKIRFLRILLTFYKVLSIIYPLYHVPQQYKASPTLSSRNRRPFPKTKIKPEWIRQIRQGELRQSLRELSLYRTVCKSRRWQVRINSSLLLIRLSKASHSKSTFSGRRRLRGENARLYIAERCKFVLTYSEVA